VNNYKIVPGLLPFTFLVEDYHDQSCIFFKDIKLQYLY